MVNGKKYIIRDSIGLKLSAQLFSILGRVKKDRYVFGVNSSTSSIKACVSSSEQTQTSSHLLMSASRKLGLRESLAHYT